MSHILSQGNGFTEHFRYDEDTDTSYITLEQDVSGTLDAIANKRNENRWQKEVKEDFVHFCSIPPVVELELRNRGLNIYDKNCTKRLMQVIQSEYPYLLAHAGKKLA